MTFYNLIWKKSKRCSTQSYLETSTHHCHKKFFLIRTNILQDVYSILLICTKVPILISGKSFIWRNQDQDKGKRYKCVGYVKAKLKMLNDKRIQYTKFIIIINFNTSKSCFYLAFNKWVVIILENKYTPIRHWQNLTKTCKYSNQIVKKITTYMQRVKAIWAKASSYIS